MNTIKELRKASSMTQKAFAEYINVSKRTVESWEGGQRNCPPRMLTFIQLMLEKDGRRGIN